MAKPKVIPWAKFFNTTEDEIIHYRIVPDRTVDNNTIVLARAFHELYSAPKDRIILNLKGVKVTYRIKDKAYFDIIFRPGTACFYLSTHKRFSKFLETKCRNIWEHCAINQVQRDELNEFNTEHCIACDIRLQKANIFSLKTTTRDLDPLNSMFAVLKDLDEKQNDKVRVSMVFDSVDRLDWQQHAEDQYKQLKRGKMPRRTQINRDDIIQNIFKLTDFCVGWYIELKLMIVEGLLSFLHSPDGNDEVLCNSLSFADSTDIEVQRLNAEGGISSDSVRKIKAASYKTYIRILSQSRNPDNRMINMRTVANAFKDLSGDNELGMVELTEKKQQRRIKDIMTFKASRRIDKDIFYDEEVAKMIQLPQITLQQQYGIEAIESREVELPSEIRAGNIPIGTAGYKTKEVTSYWPSNKNVITLPKIVLGPMGSGKSEYTKSFCVHANKAGHSVVVLDYIKDCDLSNSIGKHTNHVIINLADQNNLTALAFPEVQPTKDKWDRLRVANLLSRQVEYLLNSLVPEPLSPRMSRYLDAACKVVFVHPGAKVADVLDVLTNWKVRNEYIRKAKYSECFTDTDNELVDLNSLHERDDNGKIVGTKESKIDGIIDRITVMNKDLYLRAMLKADINYEQDFCKWTEEGKTILIQLPERVFTNKQVKDTLVTYFMSRIWLTALQRKTDKIMHVVTDEIHQVPTAASLVASVITEGRKFGVDFYFTLHFFKQFQALQDAVRSSGCSYMLLAGTEKENLKALEKELDPFTVEEGLKLKPFHSLNIINYGNQYCKFISKLPKPI